MRKKLLYGLLVGLAAALAAIGLWRWGKLDPLENIAWRWRVLWLKQPSPETPRIKVILLDQASLDWGKKEMGLSWPWPRELYSALLDFCGRAGARAVAFDVIFTEPSFYGVSDDETFGAAIGRTRAYVAALYIGGETAGDAAEWPEGAPPPWPEFQGLKDWRAGRRAFTGRVVRAAFPVPELIQPGVAWGNVSDQPDPDGVFRRAALFRVFDGRAVPSLGLAAWLADQKAAGTEVAVRLEPGWLKVGDRRIPIDRRGRATLRYIGRSGTHPSFSAASIIQSELRLREGGEPVVKPEEFRDAYVFFGFSAPALLDLRPTPISRVYPGVEIHTTMLDNLLAAQFVRDARPGVVWLATLLLALLSGIAVTLGRKAWQNVAAFVVFLPLPPLAGLATYRVGIWWPVAVGEVAVLLAVVGAVVVNYATEGRQKAFIKSAFKFYLGETVIDQLLADPSRLSLGGEKRELTIFFSDIEKFSSFSERLDPTQLIGLLNEYLSEMGEIIKEEGGYLDKFIGDAIVAFWNAPVAQPDHAARACRAALRCQRRLAERRAEWQEKYGAVVKMRIGIHTGDVTVGNMGSRDRFNYTVLGDAANLASRLEGANKAFGTYFMVSESTWEKTAGAFAGRPLARLTVVGRKQPVAVFEPTGLPGETRPEWHADFERALRLFFEGKFAEALPLFERQAEDPASQAYAGRCRLYQAAPPADWAGVWNLTEKG